MVNREDIMIIYGDNPYDMIPELFEKSYIIQKSSFHIWKINTYVEYSVQFNRKSNKFLTIS
jgi:hypothetical protein